MKALRAALERLEKGEREPALASLLEAWRSHPAPAIADTIDRLGAELTKHEKPIRAVGKTSAKAAWDEAAKSGRPAMLGRLLEAIPDSIKQWPQFEAILKMPRDPRVATACLKWIEELRVADASRNGFFGAVLKLLEHTGDVRVAPILAPRTEKDQRSWTVQRFGLTNLVPLRKLVESLSAQKVPKLTPESVELLAKIDARIAAPAAAPVGTADADPATLYARVYEDPSDDAARTILSDFLQQKGDPRGEFIALQLARHGTGKKRSAQERKLEEQWGREWLGALEPAVLKAGVEFERGFVTRLRFMGKFEGRATIGAPEWSTVTHVDVSHASGFVGGSGDVLVSPTMRSLRHVVGLDITDWERIAPAGKVPWETVGWRIWHWDRLGIIGGGSGELFAAAKSLIIGSASNEMLSALESDMARLIASWPRIEAFELDGNPLLLVPLRKLAPAQRLRRLTIDGPPLRATVDGDLLEVELRHFNEAVASAVAHMIAMLGVTHAVVRANGKTILEGDILASRRASMSIAPLRTAAETAGVSLRIAANRVE